ncbi:MAG: TIGR01777 family oxidoreductase [bacterium]
MRILITGGTGFIGKPLCAKLVGLGHRVTVITRRKPDTAIAGSEGVDYFTANLYEKPELPAAMLEETDVVINLAGESIGAGRWTKAQKNRIVESRTRTTKALVEAMAKAQKRPKLFINSSAVGYYGAHGDEELDESAPAGDDFLATTCVQWEAEANKAKDLGLRLVILRTGVVLGRGGPALQKMLLPFRLFIGGPIGSGRQWLSWIHIDDLIALILFALENEKIFGALNATSPEPVTNKTFSKIIGKVLKRPSFMPVPAFVLKTALGEQSLLVLTGQRVLPQKALDMGFQFKYADPETALRAILASQNA